MKKPREFPHTIPHLTLQAMFFLGKGEWLLEFITSLIFLHFHALISNWSHGFTTFNLIMNSSHFVYTNARTFENVQYGW
jgi:hypothetical protein